MRIRAAAAASVIAFAFLLTAHADAQESQFASDVRREKEHIAESCGGLAPKKLVQCALTVTTEYPFHLAVGSLPPQNGFGVGLAFVERYTPNENWRLSWNADAVAARSGAWRGGAYMKIIRTAMPPITVRTPGAPARRPDGIRQYPVFNVYAQSTSLEKLLFFGPDPGRGPSLSVPSVFGERHSIVGGSAVVPLTRVPLFRSLQPSAIGAVNGRFIRVTAGSPASMPTIADVYSETTAPGLTHQPTFVQFQQGVRLTPSTGDDRVHLNYLFELQQFLADAGARSSFRRWSVDLRHEIQLYRTVASTGPKETNGPDECLAAAGGNSCPPITYSRNLGGTVSVRMLLTSSTALSGGRVPFYLQPTLGGSDINGQRLLASFDDYRFRGPALMALQESIEHSVWGPLGISFQAEQGKVGERARDLGFGGLVHSYTLGLTVRAGGFPMMNLSYAWGSERSHHVLATVDASLLGGSGRPSLH